MNRLPTKCARCGAEIIWATNRETGARTPLETPGPGGGNLLLDQQMMTFIKLDLPLIERAIERGESLYVNHLITCRVRR